MVSPVGFGWQGFFYCQKNNFKIIYLNTCAILIYHLSLYHQSAAMKRRSKNKETMVRIFNNSDYTLSPTTQQAIQNACVNAGISGDVTCKHTNDNTDFEPTFDVYDETDEYQFSIDTDGDVIYYR